MTVTKRVTGVITDARTKRVAGAITAANTKRVLTADAVAQSAGTWGRTWGRTWGNAWGFTRFAAKADPTVDVTLRVTAAASGGQTQRVGHLSVDAWLLLEGDESGALLLEGDAVGDVGDILVLEGDSDDGFFPGITKRVVN